MYNQSPLLKSEKSHYLAKLRLYIQTNEKKSNYIKPS